MRPMLKSSSRAALAAVFVLVAAGPAAADIATYTATLAGTNEVPPNGSPATGAATLVVDTETLQATWLLEFSGLTAAQTGAHFHNAPAGTNGGVMFGLPLGSPVNGVWGMTQPQLDELVAGNVYVNVHSVEFPGGEIRGQLTLAGVVPDEGTSFGAVKALFR